jgi:hypothetical protein
MYVFLLKYNFSLFKVQFFFESEVYYGTRKLLTIKENNHKINGFFALKNLKFFFFILCIKNCIKIIHLFYTYVLTKRKNFYRLVFLKF